MNYKDDTKKTVLITGASSGIGRDLAILFSKNNYNLVLIARNEKLLDTLKNELSNYDNQILIIIKDLAVESSYLEIKNILIDHNIFVDVLINNAGIGSFGYFVEQTLNSQLSIIDVNIRALTAMTHIILPSMIAEKRGCILNVASLAGLQPLPNMSVYSASKAYNVFFSKALSGELKGKGIKVTAICLGVTLTPFLERTQVSTTNCRLQLLPQMSSDLAASIIFNSMFSRKKVVIAGMKNRLLLIVLFVLTKTFGINCLRFLRIK